MLALVAPSFSQVSETFIEDHARNLAPGRTVLVCMDGTRAERFGHPVLSHVNPTYAADTPLERLRAGLYPRLRRRFGFGPVLSLPDRMRLVEFLRAQKVTVVFAEFGDMGPVVLEACRRLGLPLYVMFRGYDASSQLRYRSMRRRHARVFACAAGIIAESRFLADRLVAIGCPEALVTVVNSGMDAERFRPGRPEPGRLLHVGRLVEKKAPDIAIRAFGRIAGRFPGARLDVVGDGPLRGRSTAAVAELGLADRITLHGALPNDAVAALTARASIFVLHSVTDAIGQTEGFPVAISEAMASALPVISTRHSGIPEHVADGVTGILTAERDVEATAAAMARLLADPGAAVEMGRAGRAYALEHLTRARSHARLWEVMRLAERLAPLPGPRPARQARAAS
jgi:glycosyltransferase involved in cell wall biosynthesis